MRSSAWRATCHDSGVDQAPPAIVYWRAGVQDVAGPIPSYTPRDMTFAIRSDRAGAEDLIKQVGRAVWAVNPNLPLARVQTLGETYAQSMSRTSFTLVMLAIAGCHGAWLSVSSASTA